MRGELTVIQDDDVRNDKINNGLQIDSLYKPKNYTALKLIIVYFVV